MILKNRVHSTLIAFGHQVPMADLFGIAGRQLLRELDIPEPWRGHANASVALIDDLELRISEIEHELRRSGADHRYLPLLLTAPGIGWITGFPIAAEIGDISRFSSPIKLTGYTGCARASSNPAPATSAGPCPSTDRPSRATEVMRPLPDNEPDVDRRWVIRLRPKGSSRPGARRRKSNRAHQVAGRD